MNVSTGKLGDHAEIVVIGGSAGSVRFLLSLAPALVSAIDLPLLVVIHRMRNEVSKLSEILGNRLALPVKEAEEKEEIQRGIMYVAPADYHLLVEDDHTFSIVDMELVRHSRPSIDVTFASVADVYRRGAVGIVLSGANNDGADGLAAISAQGGVAIAQNPADAEVETMPRAAIEAVADCAVMGVEEMRSFLLRLQPSNGRVP